jgi:hypothetical protein
MPIQPCKAKGKSGFKYGDTGKCYTGKEAKQKAIKQGLAVAHSQNRKPHL